MERYVKGRGLIGGRFMGVGRKVCEREWYYWWEGYVCKG